MTIKASISHSFRNKDILPGKGKSPMSESFIAIDISVYDLSQHILNGNAWAVGVYKGNHRKSETFQSSQILALDLDENVSIETAIARPDIAQYAALVHSTPGHTENKAKTRVVFILDRPIADGEKWEKAARGMLYWFTALRPDEKCKDRARFFYGSNVNADNAVRFPDHRLPIEVVASWVKAWEAGEAETVRQLQEAPPAPAPKTETTQDQRQRHADAVYTKIMDQLLRATEPGRNDALNKTAYFLFGCAKGAWPGIDATRVRLDLERTGLQIGLTQKEVTATLKSAENAALPVTQTITDKAPRLEDIKPGDKEALAKFQAATIGELNSTLKSLAIASKDTTIQREQIQAIAHNAENAIGQMLALGGHTETVNAVSAAKEVKVLLQERMDNPRMVLGLRSGVDLLDVGVGGFEDGASYTFLGSTGTGKTQLAAGIGLHFARQSPGLVITCENNAIQFHLRMVAHEAGIPFSCLARGGMIEEVMSSAGGFRKFTPDERGKINEAQYSVLRSVSDTHIYPNAAPTPTVIRAICRQHRATLNWIILDSLNNITLPYSATDYERVTSAALLCEELAIEFGVPVISTCQGGRNTKGRADKELKVHDAKGSGAVEEKASGLITIYNHWYHVKQGDVTEGDNDENTYPKGTVRMNVRKLRNGITGTRFNVGYKGGIGMFNYVPEKKRPTIDL
jgi:replicative DNA helicase